MEVAAGALLLASGYILNQNDKTLRSKRINKLHEGLSERSLSERSLSERSLNKLSGGADLVNIISRRDSSGGQLNRDQTKIGKNFSLFYFNKKEITNPNFDEKAILNNLDPSTVSKIKSHVNLDRVISEENKNLNDVGFQSANADSNYDNIISASISNDVRYSDGYDFYFKEDT